MASEYQFGIDDAKVTAFAGAVVGTTKVDVLGIDSFSFGIESDSVETRGDNKSLRIRKSGKKVTGSMEQAATNLATYAVISDGETETAGVTPDVITTYTETSTAAGIPYQIEVQAADIDGATRVTILKASTVSGPTFEWAEGAFSNPGWDFEGVDLGGSLFKIEQYETEEAIA